MIDDGAPVDEDFGPAVGDGTRRGRPDDARTDGDPRRRGTDRPDDSFGVDLPEDPFDVDLPDGWSADTREGATVYENGESDRRVRIAEFSKGLSLYWWVDVYAPEESAGVTGGAATEGDRSATGDGGDGGIDGDGPSADGDDGWRRLEVGLGDSFTDPNAAASAVEAYLADAASGGHRDSGEPADRNGLTDTGGAFVDAGSE
ncbi:hypothetical protein [Halobellus sp. GM3]|uniref:hypothetical protein n=1 Tax=Halobellus sp. GM3 TaxID=3458410 RepID=UPI00403E1A02